MINELPNIGERIIVHNIRYAEAKVSDIKWNSSEHRFLIELSWTDAHGNYLGISKVYAHDQNKIWFRDISNN